MLQGEHSAILSAFIKLPFVIKIFVLSILEWPLKTGFTVFTDHGQNLRRREEKAQNTYSHAAAGTQIRYSSQLSLPQGDSCKNRKDGKDCITKPGPNIKNPQVMEATNK